MAASVWMTPWIGLPVLPELISLPVPLITPVVSLRLEQQLSYTNSALHCHVPCKFPPVCSFLNPKLGHIFDCKKFEVNSL